MELSLSKADTAAPVINKAMGFCKAAWKRVVNVKTAARLAALAPLVMLAGVLQPAQATDLLAAGKGDVQATFGADSLVIMCIYLAEFVVGIAMYIRTKNLIILLGMVVVMVFTTVVLGLIF